MLQALHKGDPDATIYVVRYAHLSQWFRDLADALRRVVQSEVPTRKKNVMQNIPKLPKENEMVAIEVFDPPMCCSTGVCGPEPDSQLAVLAAELQTDQMQS